MFDSFTERLTEAAMTKVKPRKSRRKSLLFIILITLIQFTIPLRTMGQWVRVDDISGFISGETYIIGYEEVPNSGIIIPMQNKGTATINSAGYMYSGAEPDESSNTTINIAETNETSDFEVTITENSIVNGAINIIIGDYYLGNTNTKNNCKLFDNESINTAFTPITEDNGVFKLTIEANETYNTLQYNKSTPRLAVYNATQKNLSIFRKMSEPVPPSTITITYSVNGSIDGNIGPHVIEVGQSINTLPSSSAIAPAGFNIVGWSSEEGGTSIIETPFTPEADITLYAVFSRGETMLVENVTIVSGEALTTEATTEPTTQSEDGFSYIFSEGAKKSYVPSTAQHPFTDSEAIFIGAKGAYIYNTTPFEHGITKFEIYSNRGSSKKVAVAVCFDTEEITELIDNENTWKSTLSIDDSIYNASAGIHAGSRFFRYQITNANNSQVQFRITYLVERPRYYTRIFTDETADADIIIKGPSIIISGATLDMGGHNIECADAEYLIIEDGAQLKLSDRQAQGETAVMATIQKGIIKRKSNEEGTPESGWYLLSSPVNDKPFCEINNLITTIASDYDLFEYDESSVTWRNTKNMNNPTSETNKGYLYSNASDVTLEFKGELFNETTTTYEATKTGEYYYSGFNLLGNPYCENLPWDNIISDNEAALSPGYYTLNNDGGFAAKANFSNDDIKPCQGFLIQVSEPVTLTITKPDNNRDNKARENRSPGSIKIKVSNTKHEDYAYIIIGEGNGLKKISHINKEIPSVYFPQGKNRYAIANIDDSTTTAPLSFKAGTIGKYRITIETDNEYLHLIDNLNGIETDMIQCPYYEFIASPEDDDNRFTLILKDNTNAIQDNILILQKGNELIAAKEGEMVIYDILGRPVLFHEGCNTTINTESLKPGIYLATLKGRQYKTQKIIIR